MKVACVVCTGEFEAQRSSARYCSATCRQRRKRGTSTSPGGGDGLVAAVERELRKAGRFDTVDGQLAMQLARQVTAVGATGIAGLSKELRQVRAAAMAGVEAKPSGGAPVEDEVEKARRRREEIARAAAGSA